MHWHETLNLVRSRIRRWRASDFFELWSEMLVDGARGTWHRRTLKNATLELLRRTNDRRAKHTVGDGQHAL